MTAEAAAADPPGRPRIALVVNPVAGHRRRGRAQGQRRSRRSCARRSRWVRSRTREERAEVAVRQLLACWPADLNAPRSWPPRGRWARPPRGLRVPRRWSSGPCPTPRTTTPDDTRRITAQLAALAPDLLLVAGGDGTLRDVCVAVGTALPVVGIPGRREDPLPRLRHRPACGRRPRGRVPACDALPRRTTPADVLDLDEDAYRRGEIAPRLFGEVAVPAGDRRLQARKEPSPASEAVAVAAAAEGVLRYLAAGGRWVLAPGSTVRAVGERLGLPTTLVGVDVVDVAPARRVRRSCPREAVIVATDVGAADLERLVAERPATLVVTPIGGQGFILRPGQPAALVGRHPRDPHGRPRARSSSSPRRPSWRACGGGRSWWTPAMRVLDAELAGHLTVITGPHDRTVYRVAPA